MAVFAAIARLFSNVLRLPLLPLWWILRLLARPRGNWLHVRLRSRVTELSRPRPFFLSWLPTMARALPTPVAELHRLVDFAAGDPRVRGAILEIPPLVAGWAVCASLRDVVARLRAAGKEVVAYLPQGGGNRELFVASSASRLLLGPQATLMVLGLSIESHYFRPLLDRLGVHVRPTAHGEYKTAAENLVRETMSDAQREQLSALLETIQGELLGAIAALPGMDESSARALFERGLLRGDEAVAAGIAEAVCYEDDLPVRLVRGGSPVKLIRAGRYLSFHGRRFFSRVLPRPYVAVVPVHGPIMSGAAGLGASGADPDRIAACLRLARRDRFAVGVVLHVNSPGGSALASDLIHREVARLKEKKPVVACFGDVAASGGYYVGAAAHAIVAHPVTITGSIGVVTAKVVAKGLLDKVGIRTEVLRTAPHADMFSVARELSDDEEAILQRETRGFYEAFVRVVAAGRGRAFDEVEPLARGRVWSGAEAHRRGLVDSLGGLREAVEEVRSRLTIPEALKRRVEPRLVRTARTEVPPPEPPAATAAAWAALEVVAPEAPVLMRLLCAGDRVLYYAVPPRID